MKDGPDIARVAALIGDPARANILSALMSGRALTATELASEAGVGKATASSHLGKLMDGGLVMAEKQGRHRYVRLASPDVAAVLEALMGLAAGTGHLRTRPGPKDAALRHARVCYNHLAGEMGTALYRSLLARGWIAEAGEDVQLTKAGQAGLSGLGFDIAPQPKSRAPLCRPCLDWSERQRHLGGRLGRALLAEMEARDWIKREPGSRVLRFTGEGTRAFQKSLLAA